MRYYLAIDQGGSKTAALLCDFSGKVAAETRTEGGCWFYVGLDKAVSLLQTAADSLCKAAGIGREALAFGVIGAAGINWADEKAAYTRAAEAALGIPVYCMNDAAAAVYCDGEGFANRIALCGGTEFGAAVLAEGMEEPFVYCNYTLPEDMGGNAVGEAAVNAVLRAGERLAAETSLTEEVLHYFGAADEEALLVLHRRHRTDKPLKELVPLVFAHANAGDSVSGEILCTLAGRMAVYAEGAVKKYGLAQKPTAVLLAGGVFRNDYPPMYALMERRIRAVCPRAEILRTQQEIVNGARNLGLEIARKGL